MSVPWLAQQTTMMPALTFVLVFMCASLQLQRAQTAVEIDHARRVIVSGPVFRPFEQHKASFVMEAS